MKLKIAETFSFPKEAVTQTFGILAVRGAGKSNAAAVMAEEMFAAGLPFVAVDPVGSWWGLRSSGDGKGPGLSVPIFGGRHGDVPLEKMAGQVIADLVVDQRLSCVLDLSEFSEGDKTRFLIDFAERLYRRNQDPLHLFLEEADDFIPQRPFREQARLLRAWENVVRRGRARGLGVTMITQRSAAINKNVLTQLETLIVLRTTSPQDRKAIAAWVEYHGQAKDLLESLSGLQAGEAWIWSPSWLGKMERVNIRRRSTFDSGATPKGAASSRPAATLADINLGAIEAEMKETIERAKADDPKELRRQIAELRRQAQAKPPTQADPAAVERAVQKAVAERDRHWQGEAKKLEKAAGLLAERMKKIEQLAHLNGALPKATTAPPASSPPPRPAPATRPAPRPRPAQSHEASKVLTGPEQRILDAAAWLESIGIPEPEQTAVAFLAGYTIGGGGFNNPRGNLRTKGLVDYRGNRIALTDEGRSLAKAPPAPLDTAELQRKVFERLPGPESKILQVLIDAYPEDVSYEELAQKSGYTAGGGGFNNPRGRLRSLGLIEYTSQGRAAARPLLFLEGSAALS